MVAFVEKYPNCFDRNLEIGHITASAWLLNQEGTKALLMHHAKINLWVQPGGHCDGDSNVLRVAIKEAQEESGILGIVPVMEDIFDIDIHEFPEKNGVKAHLHYDVRFLLQVNSHEALQKNEESNDLRWFDSDLPTQDRSVMRMFEKWKKNHS
jgi:8-oxo-dGTP pyrophosphatase MutT (NUDIX family)